MIENEPAYKIPEDRLLFALYESKEEEAEYRPTSLRELAEDLADYNVPKDLVNDLNRLADQLEAQDDVATVDVVIKLLNRLAEDADIEGAVHAHVYKSIPDLKLDFQLYRHKFEANGLPGYMAKQELKKTAELTKELPELSKPILDVANELDRPLDIDRLSEIRVRLTSLLENEDLADFLNGTIRQSIRETSKYLKILADVKAGITLSKLFSSE